MAIVATWVAVWSVGRGDDAPLWTNPVALMIVALALGYRGARHLKRVSLRQFTLAELGHDDRAPILLLRSFGQDNVLGSGPRPFSPFLPSSWLKVFNPHAVWLTYRCLFSCFTFEQVLEFSTRRIGPLVAIGQPETPPILGAYNVFVGDEWKDVVADLAARAQLVVLVAGSTPGLLWEVHFMLTALSPEKCLIFVPRGVHPWWWPFGLSGTRGKVWDGFRRLAGPSFPVALPARLESAACLSFSSDWKPILLNPLPWPKPAEVRNYVAYMLAAIL